MPHRRNWPIPRICADLKVPGGLSSLSHAAAVSLSRAMLTSHVKQLTTFLQSLTCQLAIYVFPASRHLNIFLGRTTFHRLGSRVLQLIGPIYSVFIRFALGASSFALLAVALSPLRCSVSRSPVRVSSSTSHTIVPFCKH